MQKHTHTQTCFFSVFLVASMGDSLCSEGWNGALSLTDHQLELYYSIGTSFIQTPEKSLSPSKEIAPGRLQVPSDTITKTALEQS